MCTSNFMAEESFLLVNLKEDKSKKLAQVLSNESCRKILEFLTNNKSATETEISEKLNIPLSTVHYNLKQLSKSGLLKADEFHYSKKGREVTHYTLANKYIIIAPSDDPSFVDKLKKIIPFTFISIIGTGFLYAYQNWFKMATLSSKLSGSYESTDMQIMRSMDFAYESSPEIISSVSKSEPNLALWFFLGTLSIILSMLIFEFIKNKKK
jgi:predicted transcriptional regulator